MGASASDEMSAEEAASFEMRGVRARPRKKIEYAPLRGAMHVKPPGSCNTKWKTDTRAIDFQAECVEDSSIYVLDACSQVSIAECKNCRIVLGPVSGSVFLIELTDCVISVAAKQIRLRNCERCEIRALMPNREGLIIEASDNLTIGAWEIAYPELPGQCALSGFDYSGPNYWDLIYDFSAKYKVGEVKGMWEYFAMLDEANAERLLFDAMRNKSDFEGMRETIDEYLQHEQELPDHYEDLKAYVDTIEDLPKTKA